MATTIYGAKKGGYWQTYMTYSTTETATQYKITVTMGLYTYADKWIKAGTRKATLSATSGTTYTASKSNVKQNGGTKVAYISSKTYTYNKTTSSQSKTVTAKIVYSGSSHDGTSTASKTFTIPALAKYTISFNANGGSGAPSSVSKYYGKSVALPTTKPTRENYAFVSWNTKADGTGTTYKAGATYSANANATLYAQWIQSIYAPTLQSVDMEYKSNTKFKGTNPIFNFTSIRINYEGIDIDPNTATSATITATIHDIEWNTSAVATATVQDGADGYIDIDIDENTTLDLTVYSGANYGDYAVYFNIDDGVLDTSYYLGFIPFCSPTFNVECGENDYHIENVAPDKDEKGKAKVVISALKYDADNSQWSNEWLGLGDRWDITEYDNGGGDIGWYPDAVNVPKECVDDVTNPTIYLKAEWRNVVSTETKDRQALYSTSRNANYNTGLANNVFVGSVNPITFPNYTSRVWYSYVNDPLYFPDTNFIEVGSNDTNVMGMVKVGEYLGIIKQSKTTDTSIYLAYATSFEDDTTFAVKQSVSGVGALGKYCFNVLGDETLFFSPEGIMAIVPSEDEQHKVQLRSYYVNKKLLAEDSPETSYSFVYDGKYILCVNNHAYVLDGNQKTSWETSKTNLQYEAYYWDNIPARFMMTNGDDLWFASETSLCRFKDKTEDFAYNDNGHAIKAEWSTIFDDDGALHYYKTMQKKGNVVSILPCDWVDNNIVEADWEGFTDQQKEDAYNENPRKYFLKKGNFYIRCKDTDEYDEEQTYYQATVYTSADVYVRKDTKDLTYIGKVDGVVETPFDTPNELFLNKKFKKYKRLQVVIRNEEVDECFGVDSIIKNFTIGNYAKR